MIARLLAALLLLCPIAGSVSWDADDASLDENADDEELLGHSFIEPLGDAEDVEDADDDEAEDDEEADGVEDNADAEDGDADNTAEDEALLEEDMYEVLLEEDMREDEAKEDIDAEDDDEDDEDGEDDEDDEDDDGADDDASAALVEDGAADQVIVNVYTIPSGAIWGDSVKQHAWKVYGGYHWALQIGQSEYSFGGMKALCKSTGCKTSKVPIPTPKPVWPPQDQLTGNSFNDTGIYKSVPEKDPVHKFVAGFAVEGANLGVVTAALTDMVTKSDWSYIAYDVLVLSSQTFVQKLLEFSKLTLPDALVGITSRYTLKIMPIKGALIVATDMNNKSP